MTTKYRYKKNFNGSLYLVEERQKTTWKIIHIFYSETACRKYIKEISNDWARKKTFGSLVD